MFIPKVFGLSSLSFKMSFQLTTTRQNNKTGGSIQSSVKLFFSIPLYLEEKTLENAHCSF